MKYYSFKSTGLLPYLLDKTVVLLRGLPGNWVQILFMDGESKITHEIVYRNIV
jgi:hypothetical protein